MVGVEAGGVGLLALMCVPTLPSPLCAVDGRTSDNIRYMWGEVKTFLSGIHILCYTLRPIVLTYFR
jgi:hypothetical protein